MNEGPVVDGRSREELLEELKAVASNYTDEWDAYSEDSATTLLRIFSLLERDVIRRLEDVPEKHRIAFFDALGVRRRPPHPARVPLTFHTIEDIDENVVIPGGTQAIAETEDGSGTFEIPQDDGFEATPATLDEVFGVHPPIDNIVNHGDRLNRGKETTLFSGSDLQEHVLYLGQDNLLNVDSGATITIRLRTTATEDILRESVVWEYYGEDEDGSVGWHPFSRRTTDGPDPSSRPDAGPRELREIIRNRRASATGVSLTFPPTGAITEATVADIESRWIRWRARGNDPLLFDIEIESISLNVERGSDNGGTIPDNILSNDVPLSVEDDEDIFPFGRMPQPPTTAYLASEEVFTKRGDTVEVRFGPPESDRPPWGSPESGDDDADDSSDDRSAQTTGGGMLEGPPEISWEYWNGNGWARLNLRNDGTSDFTEAGTVSFVVPDDLDSTSISGHEDYWIRARLVSGSYGQPRFAITDEGTRGEMVERPRPPRFGGISLSYDQRGKSFEHVLTYNNLAYREVPPSAQSTSFPPFVPLPDERQTLYLGFSESLRDGPITLYMPVSDDTYPESFEPAIRWEYCTDPERDRWAKLEVQDRTEGLTVRGIVSINFPEETTAFELFGIQKHWIRVRVTGDEFVPELRGRGPDDGGERIDARPTSNRSASPGSKAPPTLAGIHLNTQWAYNVRTIEREVLGSSDGTHGQAFTCDHTPVTEIDVWVDELPALSKKEQRELADARPPDVERVPEAGMEPVEFWVRWTEVSDFLDSSETSRHYTIDRTNGTITFGDGQQGAIPPAGDDNLRVSYKTGGEIDGTVERGTIDELKTPISLVDSVTNIEPSDAGTDVESTETVVSRAPYRIQNRRRAVTAADFEHVAKEESRELAKVKCEPERDGAGNPNPGWVTVLIVPEERRDRPSPSVELKARVQKAVSERAPATLVGSQGQRVLVRGPDYAEVSVETTIRASGVESVSNLKETVETELEGFFHPLSGGPTETGWDFGESPELSQITKLITSIDGVDTVQDVVMTVSTREEAIKIRDKSVRPSLRPDALVCSGTHEVTVRMTGRT